MNFPLLIYRFSGWLIIAADIFLSTIAIKKKQMWRGRYLFLGVLFCLNALSSISSMLTALVLTNNLFIEFIIVPLSFGLKAMYLRDFHKSKAIKKAVVVLIIAFLGINVFFAIYKDGFKAFNTMPIVFNRIFFVFFSVWNLSILFKDKVNIGKLRQSPDFWFTITILCFGFKGLLFSIITDVSYVNSSDLVLYFIFISENLINTFLYYGYYKGVKLL
jgi:hypothetical protein